MIDRGRDERWGRTARLSAAVAAVLVILVLLFLALAGMTNGAGYPLGYVVAASGLPLAGVILVFWFARRQERIDERHGFYET